MASSPSFLAGLLFGAALALAPAVRAAPASAESVEQLLVLTRAPALIETMLADTEAAMRRTPPPVPPGQALTDAQRAALDRLPARMSAMLREEMSWEKLRPGFVRMYRETFEQEEIDGLIAFYRTPLGQAYVDKLPVVMRKSMESVQETLQRLMPKMSALMQETMREAGAAK